MVTSFPTNQKLNLIASALLARTAKESSAIGLAVLSDGVPRGQYCQQEWLTHLAKNELAFGAL